MFIHSLLIAEFKQRVSDVYKQDWYSDVCTKDKLRTYRNFKSMLEPEKYLLEITELKYRHALARMRCSCLGLRVQEGSYIGIDIEDRICEICSEGVEDEFHVIFVCPLYQNLRYLLPFNDNDFPSEDKFFALMRLKSHTVLRNLGKFIYKAMILRKEFYLKS